MSAKCQEQKVQPQRRLERWQQHIHPSSHPILPTSFIYPTSDPLKSPPLTFPALTPAPPLVGVGLGAAEAAVRRLRLRAGLGQGSVVRPSDMFERMTIGVPKQVILIAYSSAEVA